MIVKVCGMRNSANITDVSALGINLMGFIFYNKSPRFIGDIILPKTADNILRVGVFVNETIETIKNIVSKHSLDYVQLHGNELPEFCLTLKQMGYKIIKCISINDKFDFIDIVNYEPAVDLFLFDTKCSAYGGSGKSFDWTLLNNYVGNTDFLLSGGINENMACDINQIKHPKFVGVDLNSGFEMEPALKDVNKLRNFLNEIV